MNERPLKFRIYSFVDKSWYYFGIYEGYPQGIYGAVTPPQQFTGLTDKNGKEIYEGDIIEDFDDFYDGCTAEIFEVFFNTSEGSFQFLMRGHKKEDSGHPWHEVSRKCYVIGNIIENKKLLKNEK